MARYIYLVWAEQVKGFANWMEIGKNNFSSEMDRVLVIGDAIRIEDYKALERQGIPFDIEPQFAEAEDCEVFLLGTCFTAEKGGATLVSYAGFSKKAKSIAAKLSIDIKDAKELIIKDAKEALKGKPSEKPRRKRTVKKAPDESLAEDPVNQPAEVKPDDSLKAPAPEKEQKKKEEKPAKTQPVKKVGKGISITEDLRGIIGKEYPALTSGGMLAMIESAVQNAHDAKAGLEFQLTLSLGGGKKGKDVAALIAPHFDELKKKLGGN